MLSSCGHPDCSSLGFGCFLLINYRKLVVVLRVHIRIRSYCCHPLLAAKIVSSIWRLRAFAARCSHHGLEISVPYLRLPEPLSGRSLRACSSTVVRYRVPTIVNHCLTVQCWRGLNSLSDASDQATLVPHGSAGEYLILCIRFDNPVMQQPWFTRGVPCCVSLQACPQATESLKCTAALTARKPPVDHSQPPPTQIRTGLPSGPSQHSGL